MFERLRDELRRAFGAPDESYEEFDAEAVIERGRRWRDDRIGDDFS
jgi:hypothetical protein